MRWDNLTADPAGDRARNAALFGADAVTTRTFDTSKLTSDTRHVR
ncbi:hypothetical protein ACFVRU_03620 [Streptomyces sp. NPDC057927]